MGFFGGRVIEFPSCKNHCLIGLQRNLKNFGKAENLSDCFIVFMEPSPLSSLIKLYSEYQSFNILLVINFEDAIHR